MKHSLDVFIYPSKSKFRKEIERFAISSGLSFFAPHNIQELKAMLTKKHYIILFIDEEEECIEILDETKDMRRKSFPVLLLEKKSTRLIKEAIKKGVADFLISPFDSNKLELIVSKASLVREFGEEILPSIFLGESSKTSKKAIVREQLPHILKSISLEEVIKAKFEDVIEKGEEIGGFLPIIISEVEKSLISYTLKRCNGNKLRASKILGINRNTLVRKLKEYGLSTN